MLRRHFRKLIALVLAGLSAAAGSSPVTFDFAGSVTSDPFGLSSFGAPINGSFTFDAAAVDSIGGSSLGSYASVGPAFGFTANVDGTTYSVGGSSTVNTANNIGVDQYGVIALEGGLTLELFFEDATQTALGSDALPLSAVSLAAFAVREFRLFSPDAEFVGSIDSLSCAAGCSTGDGGGTVPEPASLWLAGIALLALTRVSARPKRMRSAARP